MLTFWVFGITSAKYICADFSNCSQAMSAYNWWATYLDKDKDWIPCETICSSADKSTTTNAAAPKPTKTTTKKVVKKPVVSKYKIWPKWWCYYVNSKWKNIYVDKKYCK